MRTAAPRYVTIALVALLSVSAVAKDDNINVLVFRSADSIGASSKAPFCTSPFRVWQELDPYFKNLKQKKVNGSVRFVREGEILKSFPREITVGFEFLNESEIPIPCPISARSYDPARVRFRAEWHNRPQITRASGLVVRTEHSHTGPWCEDKCGQSWTYELRIDSADVALTSQLEVTIDALDGTELADFVGELSRDGVPEKAASYVGSHRISN